eukprot:scaffold70230_cov25-Tisochrysis_lutea.AAC.5
MLHLWHLELRRALRLSRGGGGVARAGSARKEEGESILVERKGRGERERGGEREREKEGERD